MLLQSSTDQNVVDTDIPYRLAGLAFALVQLLGIIVVMSLISWVIFLLFLAVLAISYWYQVCKPASNMVNGDDHPALENTADFRWVVGSCFFRPTTSARPGSWGGWWG